MSEGKHTPGPWVVTEARGDEPEWLYLHVEPAGKYRGSVAHVSPAEHIGGITRAECRANATLVSAAPELLAALKRIVFDWDGEPEDMAEAQEAIRKAEGRA